ncbi:MAG: UxaA family hydrolase [Firmicutes bacterium]|nr:UxaA family hydrolase [Bacillota bacterium]
MYNCVVINVKDTAATLTAPVKKGETVSYLLNGEEHSLTAEQDITRFHKIALKDIKKGDIIVKYGCKIGFALSDIKAGEHIHTHNLDSNMPK